MMTRDSETGREYDMIDVPSQCMEGTQQGPKFWRFTIRNRGAW